MLTLATVLGGIALAVIIVMAIPMSMVFHAEWNEAGRLRGRFVWLFGLVDVDLASESKQKAERREKPKPTEPSRKRARSVKRASRAVKAGVAVLRSKGFLSRALRFLREMVRQFRPRDAMTAWCRVERKTAAHRTTWRPEITLPAASWAT